MAARTLGDFGLLFAAPGYSTSDGSENSVRCTARVRDGGVGRRGVKITLGGEIVPLDDTDSPVATLPSRTARSDGSGNLEIDFPLDDLPDEDLAILVEGTFKTRRKIDEARVECALRNRVPCTSDDHIACLLGGERFQVETEWKSSSSSGTGVVVSSSAREAFFSLGPGNGDVLVKVLDGCAMNGHYWVFYSAATSVEYDLTVTDTETGYSKGYSDAPGTPSAAVTDTAAFATCP